MQLLTDDCHAGIWILPVMVIVNQLIESTLLTFMADHSKETGKVKKHYLFDFQDFIDELRSDEKKKKTIEDYEKHVLKGKKIKGDVRDQVWYKEYLSKFKPVPKYKVPEELEDDFDWDLLFQLVAGSFSSKYDWSYEDSVPDLLIHVENDEGTRQITKTASELWSFQILRLFEIYCEEQINLENYFATDEEGKNEGIKERRKKISYFSRRIKSSGFKEKKKEDSKDSDKDKNIVYYYCSLESAYHILKSGKIFASDLLYMNDKEELNFGIEVMMEALRTIAEDKSSNYDKKLKKWLEKEFLNSPNEEKFKKELEKDHVYIACFTHKSDDLNQWRAYGDNGYGVCIKFDFNVCLNDKLSDDFWMQDVVYIDKNKIIKNKNGIREQKKKKDWQRELKHFESVFKEIKDNYEKTGIFDISDELRRNLRFFKNSSFIEEKEFRQLHLDRNNKYMPKIRMSKGYLIPYIELELGNEKKETSVKEITIGPAVNYYKAKRSFEEFFKVLKADPACKYDYSHVKILESPIPYLP